MSYTTIIWDAMSVIITDDHPVLYQFIKGKCRSRDSAVMRLTGIMAPMFMGAYDDAMIRGVARQFLKQRETDYTNGLLKIKPIHSG